jgi:hypothetical protein
MTVDSLVSSRQPYDPMRTTYSSNKSTRTESAASASSVVASLGRIDLIGSSGVVEKSWPVSKSKIEVGSSPSCFIQIEEDGVYDRHLTLVFGKRHTLLRAIGPARILDRNVREWLIDIPTEVSIGGIRFVVHPFQPVSDTVLQVERLIDQAARLCKDSSLVSGTLDVAASFGGVENSYAIDSGSGMPSDREIEQVDSSDLVDNSNAQKRLENIESLLATLQESLEQFRESISTESKQTTEVVAKSFTSEFESFGQTLFSSLSQQMTQQTETHQNLVSDLSERVVDRLEEMGQQLTSVKEASLKSSEDLLHRASAYQEWTENRLNEIVAQREELIEAIQLLRTEIQSSPYPLQAYSDPNGADDFHSIEDDNRIDRQPDSGLTDHRIAESLERAQLQLQNYNQQIRQLTSERLAAEQQVDYLSRDRQAVEAIDPSVPHEAVLSDSHITSSEYVEYEQPRDDSQFEYGASEENTAEYYQAQPSENVYWDSMPEEANHNAQEVFDPQDSYDVSHHGIQDNQYVENQYIEPQYAESSQGESDSSGYSAEQGFLQNFVEPVQENSLSEITPASESFSSEDSQPDEAFETGVQQSESAPKLPAWFTDSEPVSGVPEASEVGEYLPQQQRDESRSQRLQEMLRQVSDNFREPNFDLDRSDENHENHEGLAGSYDQDSDLSGSAGYALRSKEEEYVGVSEERTFESVYVPTDERDQASVSGLESSRYFSGFMSEEMQAEPSSPSNAFTAHERQADQVEQAESPESFTRDEQVEQNADSCSEEETIEQYMQRLLNRVRTGSESEPASPQPTNRSSAHRQEPATTRASSLTVEPESEATKPAKQEPLTQASFVPRMQAPELRDDLNMLRELANSNARRAINRSDVRRSNSTFYFKLAVTGVAAASAVSLFLLNGFTINMPFAGMVSAVIVTFLWGYDSLRHFNKVKATAPEPSELNQEPASARESANSRQNTENRWRPTPA